jgi:hypothetical protein
MILLSALACSRPDVADLFGDVQTSVVPDGAAAGVAFADAIDGATTSLSLALPAGNDPLVTEAVLAAWDRGVRS